MNPSECCGGNQLDISGRQMFIAGGTGYLGRTLLDRLGEIHDHQGQRFQATVLSRDPDLFLQRFPNYRDLPWLRFMAGSLDNLPTSNLCFTDIIHAAADTHLEGRGSKWIRQIVSGTHAMLDFALKTGAERFLLTSSGAIYGQQPAGMEEIVEDYGGAPPTNSLSSTYGQAKRVAEQLCTVYHKEHGLHTIIARCFSFSGKHIPLDGPYAIGNFIRDATSGDDIKVKGDGTTVRSYLDGAEMAHWLLTLLYYGVPGDAYNVGSDRPITMLELAQTIAKLLAPERKVLVEGAMVADAVRSRYIPSIQKARALGLSPRYSIEEIVSLTAAGLRKMQVGTR